MSNPIVIANAWIEVIKGNTTEEHKRRSEICNKCELKEYGDILSVINDELINVIGFRCGECGCPLIAKIRSTDKCPLKKW